MKITYVIIIFLTSSKNALNWNLKIIREEAKIDIQGKVRKSIVRYIVVIGEARCASKPKDDE